MSDKLKKFTALSSPILINKHSSFTNDKAIEPI
jgi:hypothetical protein